MTGGERQDAMIAQSVGWWKEEGELQWGEGERKDYARKGRRERDDTGV